MRFPPRRRLASGALNKALAAVTLGRGRCRRARQALAHPAARGGRFRRLSDRAAACRRLAARHSERPARAERGDWPGEPFPESACFRSSPAAFPSSRARTRAFATKVRYTGNPVRPAVIAAAAHALPRFRRPEAPRAGHRRLSGRTGHGRRRTGGAGAHQTPTNGWIRLTHAGARGGQGERRGGLRADGFSGRDRRVLRRSAGAHRRRRIWSSAAPAPRPSPSLR